MHLDKSLSRLRELMNGSLKCFGGPEVPEMFAGRLRAGQISTIAKHTPWIMAANVFNAAAFLLAYLNTPQNGAALVWAFLLITLATFLYLRNRARRDAAAPITASVRAVHKTVVYAMWLGAMWGLLPLVFLSDARPDNQIIVITLVVGMACGAALTLSVLPVAGIAFMLPLFVACVYAFARMESKVFLLVTILLVVYFAVLMRAIVIYACQFAERYLAEITNEQAARTDSLTGLPNRASFDDHFDELARRAAKYDEKFAVYFIDLDKFKDVNDNFGHDGGDLFLVEVADRLRLCMRAKDYAARLAGDEFAVIATGVADSESALAIAERLLNAFSKPFRIHDVSIEGSATIGVAMIPSDGIERTQIMCKADEALYSAKNLRRGTCQFFDPDNENSALLQKGLLKDLRSATGNNEFELAFQPLIDLRSNAVTCFEALLRWRHPIRGMIAPADFIALAERAGLIHEIGDWVINSAVREASQWPSHIRVAINVSAAQFRTLEIVSILDRAITQSGIDPSRIELEITESAVLADTERTETVLRDLKRLGLSIALDDFGTGYSCLTHLVRVPIDRLKIDRCFIDGIPHSQDCRKVVRGIVGLAREFGLALIAEGVETKEHLTFVRDCAITEAQGYYISKPMPALEVRRFLDGYAPGPKAAMRRAQNPDTKADEPTPVAGASLTTLHVDAPT